jgi:hypothetical protein
VENKIFKIFICLGENMMILGIPDPWVLSGYLLVIISTLFCVVYGLINWNKGDDDNSSD